jgi:hypothetical protein
VRTNGGRRHGHRHARRDVIDVAIPTVEDHLEQHAAYCRALIGQRCPELSEADIAEAFTIPTEEPDAGAIWTEIGMLAAECVARGVYEATTLDVPGAQPSWRRLYGA